MTIIDELKLLRPEPGDIVVIKLKAPLGEGHLEELSANVAPMFPDNRVLVLDEGHTIDLVRVGPDGVLVEKDEPPELDGSTAAEADRMPAGNELGPNSPEYDDPDRQS